MKIIMKEPDREPRELVIPNKLNVLQALVDGYIETLTFEPKWCVICNEEGRIRDMPYNCEVLGVEFCGPILFVGVKDSDFCDVPFTIDELKRDLPELFESEA